MNVLVTGAAGNLGTHLSRFLLSTDASLRLLVHRKPPAPDLLRQPRVSVVRGDLSEPESLVPACQGIDCVVHLAGVLFQPNPARFLPVTNTLYAKNMVDAAIGAGVRRFILVSFPHVEGESTPDAPARGLPDAHPGPVHARTRLAAEQYLTGACIGTSMRPVILRAGVIYGRDVKLIEAARFLLRWRLMAVWRKPTWVHLLALPDFLAAVWAAIVEDGVCGIYNICDEEPLLLQEFLDTLASCWGYRRPLRLPDAVFTGAAALCERAAMLLPVPAPLNRDILAMGRMSVVADTSRMRKELLTALSFPTLREGIRLLRPEYAKRGQHAAPPELPEGDR
jgi:nucleoside-diphosphate-sugar epimerase